MTAVETRGSAIGTSVKRKEDATLLRGRGTYVENLMLPGTVFMVVVRSPYPHARIKRVDLSAARAAEGVVAAFSGADLADDWAGGLPCAWPVTEDIKMPPHFPLATDETRYQGDGVAVVIAESRALAKDAAELVEVEYEQLPSVADVEKALGESAPLVHSDLGTNECYVWKLDSGDPDGAIASADTSVTCRYRQPRLIPNAIEPRGVLAQVGPTDEVTLWSATQVPHILRFALQLVTGISESKIRVIAPDVGGGFGSKLNVYAEEALAVALARRLGRPVKWIEERSENLISTGFARDFHMHGELALKNDGTMLGLRASLLADEGAFHADAQPSKFKVGLFHIVSGSYDLPAAHVRAQVAAAVDVIVQLARLRDGRRVFLEVAVVEGTKRGEPVIEPLYRFRVRAGASGRFEVVGTRPALATLLQDRGESLSEDLFTAGEDA